MSDFDVMLQKRKEEMNKRRKRKKDSELINDNDDLIAELIKDMKNAAEVGQFIISAHPCRVMGIFRINLYTREVVNFYRNRKDVDM